MTTAPPSLDELTQRAISVLVRELGVADTARFLSQYATKRGDYTKERHAILPDLSLEEVLEAAKQHSLPRRDLE